MINKWLAYKQHYWQTQVEKIDLRHNAVDYTDHTTIYERCYLRKEYYKALDKRNFYREWLHTRLAKKKYA